MQPILNWYITDLSYVNQHVWKGFVGTGQRSMNISLVCETLIENCLMSVKVLAKRFMRKVVIFPTNLIKQ